ncbi:MAG TPA: hypothetical protein VN026_01565 [Bacteroidia bacterium]|jgi:hypothetical protein|nr:hypothetical protein [Bacteroidia bacterium]
MTNNKSVPSKKKIIKTSEYDRFYSTCIRAETKIHWEWTKVQLERGVPLSVIQKEAYSKAAEIQNSVYKLWPNGDKEIKADPFMALMLDRFEKLLSNKEPNPMHKLISKLDEIKEETKELRIYAENEFIKQDWKVLIPFIAKYKITQGLHFAFKGKAYFTQWQESNLNEAKEKIIMGGLEDFLLIEKKLFNRHYINFCGQWPKSNEKKFLVAFILILIERGYFKKRNSEMKILKDIAHRKFFEKRYRVTIAKEFQPNRRKELKEFHFKPFEFIPSQKIQKA